MELETVIGLEVHIQLKTRTKLFCGCAVAFGREPNTLTCPVCTGQPGVLPVLNGEALCLAVKAGLALNCRIACVTKFHRKNYFYPDLPKGYQISQFDLPVAESGFLEIDDPENGVRRIGILRAHLEEDAGKAVHPEGSDTSLVDLNRAGVPLLEIVGAPDIASPLEAHAYLKELHRLMRYIGISDCDMEKGSLRCDANISLRPAGGEALGVKTEIKNMNSFYNVEKALAYEIARQREILSTGGTIHQETRMWREDPERTEGMRSEEQAHDYRYFPEPDLPPFEIPSRLTEELLRTLPELPRTRRMRFAADYGLDPYDINVLTAERELADFFEACTAACKDPAEVSKWIQSGVMKEINERGLGLEALALSPAHLADLIAMVKGKKLSRQAAMRVLTALIDRGGDPEGLVREMGLEQVSDRSALNRIVDEVMAQCASMVEEYRGGKEATLNALVGRVMKASKGTANPQMVRELLIRKIKGP